MVKIFISRQLNVIFHNETVEGWGWQGKGLLFTKGLHPHQKVLKLHVSETLTRTATAPQKLIRTWDRCTGSGRWWWWRGYLSLGIKKMLRLFEFGSNTAQSNLAKQRNLSPLFLFLTIPRRVCFKIKSTHPHCLPIKILCSMKSK